VFKASFAVLNVVLTIHLSDAADPYLGVQANFTNGDECSLEARTAVVQFQCYAVKYCRKLLSQRVIGLPMSFVFAFRLNHFAECLSTHVLCQHRWW